MSLYTQFDHTAPPMGPDGTPFEYFEALRDEMLATDTPIGWSEKHGGFWVACGFDVCREIFHDTEHFSNRGITFPPYALGEDSILMLAGHDAPEHKKYRKLVQGPFSPQTVVSYNAQLQQTTDDLIDGFIEDGEVNIVRALTDEVPARLTAIILGLDPEDGDLYRKWCWAMTHLFITDPQTAGEQVAEMDEYFTDLLAHRRKHLGDDILSLVMQSEIDGESLTDQEIRDFFVTLLLAGIENTSKLLSSMFWRLGWDGETRRRMAVMSPERLLVAMDEFLRFYPPGIVGRLLVKPVEVGGVQMQEGQHVVLFAPISNRDPRGFPHPDALVLERESNRHFGLGLGVHRCLGAHLVRYEGQIVAESMLRRIPDFELDASKPPTWVAGQVMGMTDVSLVFPPGGGRETSMTISQAA